MKKVKIQTGAKAEQMPGFLLWQVSKQWQQQLESEFKNVGLSHTQAILLANIFRLTQEGDKVTQILLSKKTSVDPVTTSQTIRTLEKKGLITRNLSSKDKRAYYVSPTKKGKEVTMVIIQSLPELQEKFFQSLGGEVEIIVRLLQQLINANK